MFKLARVLLVLALVTVGTGSAVGLARVLLPVRSMSSVLTRGAQRPMPAPAHAGSPATLPVITPTPEVVAERARAVPRAKYLVLLVLDGARPDYFTVSGIPHVRALMRSGVQYTGAWAGILESETPSGHASITSGSQPTADGVLSFDWATSNNTPITLFNEQSVRNGLMENIMRAAPAPSIAGLLHRQNRRAKVVALSGYKYYAADALGGPDADVIMYYAGRKNGMFGPTAIPGHAPPASVLRDSSLVLPSRKYPLGRGNHMAMRLAGKTFRAMRPAATLINLPEFDWPLGHVLGASRDRNAVQTLMRDFDSDLAALEETYRRAGVLRNTLFVITADHGFSQIQYKMSHTVINDAVAAAGTSIVRDTYHTAAYAWLKDGSKAAAAAANISHQRKPYIQSVYFRTMGANGPMYLRATGANLLYDPAVEAANQQLLSTFNGPNGPDLAVFATERAMFVAGGESTWKGDHGGADWGSQHLPLILSGPGIRRGVVSDWPARLEDIAPTVLTAMGAPTTGMQGIPLADALEGATPEQLVVQRAVGARVRPVVDALRNQSNLEVQRGK